MALVASSSMQCAVTNWMLRDTPRSVRGIWDEAAQPSAAVTPGTIVTSMPWRRRYAAFLASPAEHHRIAALEADDAAATAGVFQQQGVDLGLLHGVSAGAFAGGDAFGVAAGEFQHAGADQVVVQDHIGTLDGADRGQGQKLGVAWAGADKVDHAWTDA